VKCHPKLVEQLTDTNKLYIAATCWTTIDTYYAMHGQLNKKKLIYCSKPPTKLYQVISGEVTF